MLDKRLIDNDVLYNFFERWLTKVDAVGYNPKNPQQMSDEFKKIFPEEEIKSYDPSIDGDFIC